MSPNRKMKLGTIIILALFYFNSANCFLERTTSNRNIRQKTCNPNHGETEDLRRFGENRLQHNERSIFFDKNRMDLREISNNIRDFPKSDARNTLNKNNNLIGKRFSPNRLTALAERRSQINIDRNENRKNNQDYENTRSRLTSHGNSFARTTSARLSNYDRTSRDNVNSVESRRRILDDKTSRSSRMRDDRRNRLNPQELRQNQISRNRNTEERFDERNIRNRVNERGNDRDKTNNKRFIVTSTRRNTFTLNEKNEKGLEERSFSNRVSERRNINDKRSDVMSARRSTLRLDERSFRNRVSERRNNERYVLNERRSSNRASRIQNTITINRRSEDNNMNSRRYDRDSQKLLLPSETAFNRRTGSDSKNNERSNDRITILKSRNAGEISFETVRPQEISERYSRFERSSRRISESPVRASQIVASRDRRSNERRVNSQEFQSSRVDANRQEQLSSTDINRRFERSTRRISVLPVRTSQVVTSRDRTSNERRLNSQELQSSRVDANRQELLPSTDINRRFERSTRRISVLPVRTSQIVTSRDRTSNERRVNSQEFQSSRVDASRQELLPSTDINRRFERSTRRISVLPVRTSQIVASRRSDERRRSTQEFESSRVHANRQEQLSNSNIDRRLASRRNLEKIESKERNYRVESARSRRISSRIDNSNTRSPSTDRRLFNSQNNRRLIEKEYSVTQGESSERRSRTLTDESIRKTIDNKGSTSERRHGKSVSLQRRSADTIEDLNIIFYKRRLSNEDRTTKQIPLSKDRERIQYHRERTDYLVDDKLINSASWLNIVKALLLSLSIAQIISSSNPKNFRFKRLTNLFVTNKVF